MIFWLLTGLLLIITGAFASIILNKYTYSGTIGVVGLISGCLLSLYPAIKIILSGKPESFTLVSDTYYGNFIISIDSLSAFFLLPILFLSIISSIYGFEYMKSYKDSSKTWFFFGFLIASMIGVVTARNGALFLICWEIMALSSFFLVSFEDEKKEVRRASLIYIVATHIGTVFLLVFFALCWVNTGSLDFSSFKDLNILSSSYIDLLFVLAVIGFGTKAGFLVLHVWLPEAHPAAPSHVSAIMSGVMIKTGIYGIIRVLMLLGEVHAWWGWMLVTIGIFSGITGILFAMAQQDLKRLLAYSSVENIGIITFGIGMGIIGLAYNSPVITITGFGGGLLHVMNHSLFKGLLFLGAGSVLHATGTRDMEKLGGLLKHMPWTGTSFLIGSVAISGLPPLNGFVSEFLIYVSSFNGIFLDNKINLVFSMGVIVSLAIIGAHAAACFSKAFGIVFLGSARSKDISDVHEAGTLMKFSMSVLALGCILMGLLAPLTINLMSSTLKDISGYQSLIIEQNLLNMSELMWKFLLVAIIFLVIIFSLVIVSNLLRKKRTVNLTETWGCAYDGATSKMQYTSYSFAQPILHLFNFLLRQEKDFVPVKCLFPRESSLRSNIPDLFYNYLLHPLLLITQRTFMRFKWIQHGNLQLYILYITATLITLLIWKVS